MARKSGSTATRTEAVEAEAPVEVEAVEADTTEAPAEVEAVEADTTEAEIDLTAFQAALDAALAEADSATGDLPEAPIAAVREQYQALDGLKPKNAAKAVVDAGIREAVTSMDMVRAKALMTLQGEALVAAKGGKPAKAVDPTEAYVAQRAVLVLALFLNQAGKPEGVADDADTQADEKAADLFRTYSAEAEEKDPLVVKAEKIAHTKVTRGTGGRTSTGERRDLGAHISDAFEGVEEGTWLSVAEIRKHKSEIYGDDLPSAGAITNRIKPKSGETTVPGIRAEEREINGRSVLGAVKVA